MRVEDLVDRKTFMSFPNIEVKYSITLPLVTTDLEKGDMQVILEYNGKRKCICRISLSAINIKHLIDCTGDVIFNKSPEESFVIKSIQDYLDVV